jgi:hypothetical protein
MWLGTETSSCKNPLREQNILERGLAYLQTRKPGAPMAYWPWIERTFHFDYPTLKFWDLVERVRGTPARLEERLGRAIAARTASPSLLPPTPGWTR